MIRTSVISKTSLQLSVDYAMMYSRWKLTKVQSDVMGLYLIGVKPTEIAAKICRSPKTISTHRNRVMEKVGVETWEELVYLACEYKILVAKQV